MKFDDLDTQMRVFETAHDHCVLPGIFMVARLDGRGFTRLTRQEHKFEAPFDERFRDYMTITAGHLMTCGFRAVYGHTQSDEISILLHRDEASFDRKLRKLNSILAGEASACISLHLDSLASFDCRISQLPTEQLVVKYFRWRQEDATRNALNSHCYWLMRKAGKTVKEATAFLTGQTTADKNEFLFHHGINFNKLPAWERRGVGLYWETYKKTGENPKTGELATATRRRVKVDKELPMKETYDAFIRDRIAEARTQAPDRRA